MGTCRYQSFDEEHSLLQPNSSHKIQNTTTTTTRNLNTKTTMNTQTRTSHFSRLAQVLLALCFTACHAHNLTFHQGCDGQDLVCRVIKSTATYETSGEQSADTMEAYECLQGDLSYDLSLPQSFIDANHDLDQGFTHISIPGGCINGTTVTYPSNATISVLPEQHRHLEKKKEGNLTVLFVRVTQQRDTPHPANFKVLETLWSNRPGSFVEQMNECSFGKLNFQKAEGPGIRNGMYEIDLDYSIEDMRHRDVERRIIPKLDVIGGESAFDHVIYCLPGGTRDRANTGNKNWVAYALLNHGRSVYNEAHCGSLTTTLHEVGHNLGLHHANQDGFGYADITGNMGYSTRQQYGPLSCYNAQKNWQLGWYDDKSLDLTNSVRGGAWAGRLVAFVDYDKTVDTDAVVIKVGTLYVQYNRRRDFNAGTRENGNQAVIVSAPNTRSPQSNLLGGIAKEGSTSPWGNPVPSTFVSRNFEGTGHDLIFEVCDQVDDGPPDYIHLSIHLDDGVQSSMCSVPLVELTDAPSSEPTMSAQPTTSPAPSDEPSSSPTDSPTSSPSSRPSASPTVDCTGMDQPGLVPVNHRFGNQTCSWIASHKVWKKYLCQEGFEAFEHCQDTCDSCNAQVQEKSDDGCEDSREMFYVNQHLGNIRCFWIRRFLERSPHWTDRICASGQPAHDHCPETCGTCTDTCEDQTGVSFYVNRRQGFQDCAWLASRPLWQAKLCKKGHKAYRYCNEICDTCTE